MEEESKNKRVRRTRAEIEADVFNAIRELAAEKGLGQVSFADLVQRTGTQMSVLLNNYISIEQVLDKYAYISDYRLYDTLKYLIGQLYHKLREHHHIREIARDPKTCGVADDVIEKCTGIRCPAPANES